jgi:hypothetical protein
LGAGALMRKLLLALAVFATLAGVVWYWTADNDHLSPEGSGMWNGIPLSASAEKAFKPLMAGDVLASVVGDDGGMRLPFLVGVRRNKASYEIFGATIKPDRQMLSGEVLPCDVAISGDLARKITTIWHVMLNQSRSNLYGKAVLDGDTFHFSAPIGGQMQRGRAWVPEPNSKVDRLLDVSRQMKTVCQENRPGMLADLTRKVDALLDLL